MASNKSIKELDDILQLVLPDDYYKAIRKKLIPYLFKWKRGERLVKVEKIGIYELTERLNKLKL